MARMPDIEAEIKRDWRAAEDRMRHLMHHGAPQPAAQPPPQQVPHNETQEEHMQLLAEIEDHARQVEGHIAAALQKFQQIDHAALGTLDAILANPETAEVFALLGQFTGVAPGSLATGANVLKMTLATLGGQQPAPAQQPA
jgi:hypothetical protein